MEGQVGIIHETKNLSPNEEFIFSTSNLGLIIISSSSTGATAIYIGSAYGTMKIAESNENFSGHFEVSKTDSGIKIKNIHSVSRFVEITVISHAGR